MAVVNEVILRVDTGQPVKSTKDLRDNVNSLRDAFIKANNSGEDTTQILQDLTRSQNELIKVNNLARNSFGGVAQVLTNTTRVASGLASGFSAFQSVSALVGGSNEALEKTFIKLQAGMALVQGAQGLAGLNRSFPALIASAKNALPAIRALWTTLSANPLGAITLLIGGVVAILASLTTAMENNNRVTKQLNESYNEYKRNLQEINDENEYQIRLLRARGATEAELSQARISQIEKEKDEIRQALIAYIGNQEAALELLESASKKGSQVLTDAFGSLASRANEAFRGYLDRYQELSDNIVSINREDALRIEQDNTNANNRIIADAERSEKERIRIAQQAAQQRLQIQQQEQSQIEQINRELANNNLTSYQLQIQQLTETYNTRLALLQKYGEDTTELTRQFEANIRAVTLQEQQDITNSIIQSNEEGYSSRLSQTTQFYNELISANDLYIQQLQNDLLESELRLFSVDSEAETEEVNAHIANITNLINEATLAIGELQLEYLETYSDTLQEILEDENLSAEFRIQTEQELADTLNGIGQQHVTNRKTQIQQEIAEANRQASVEEEINNRRVASRESLLSSFASIGNSLGALFGQETAAGKAAALAGTTIDTLRGAIGAYQSLASIPLVGPALGAAAATAVGLAGAVNYKQILSVNPNGNSSAPSVDVPAPSYNTTTTPDISGWYTPELTPVVNELQSEEEREAQRVFILEDDISRSNNRVIVRETETNI